MPNGSAVSETCTSVGLFRLCVLGCGSGLGLLCSGVLRALCSDGRKLDDLDRPVVVRIELRRTRTGGQGGIGVRTATEFGVHDMTVGGEFVSAHTERCPQRSRQRR